MGKFIINLHASTSIKTENFSPQLFTAYFFLEGRLVFAQLSNYCKKKKKTEIRQSVVKCLKNV